MNQEVVFKYCRATGTYRIGYRKFSSYIDAKEYIERPRGNGTIRSAIVLFFILMLLLYVLPWGYLLLTGTRMEF